MTGAVPSRPGVPDLLRWAVVLGVLTGVVEVTFFVIDRYVFGRIIGVGPHVVWMSPAATVLLQCLVAVPLALLAARILPQRRSELIIGLPLFVSAAGLAVYFHPRIHWGAALVLALGATVQATRLLTRRRDVVTRVLRRAAPAAVALVALLAGSVFGWEAWSQRREAARVGVAPPGAPNVLLIVMDTVRADGLSLYGYHRPTSPNLARFAQGGATFSRAIATSPWTAPSHASLFTGAWPLDMRIGWRRPLPDEFTTLAESLQAHGYQTAAFVANTFGCTYERGISQGFIRFQDYPVNVAELVRSAALPRTLLDSYQIRRLVGSWEVPARQDAASINQALTSWLDVKARRPFFAFINYFDAHDPYLPPPPFDHLYQSGPRRNPWLVRRRWDTASWSAADIADERNAYDGAVTYLDTQLGALFGEMGRRGLLDNTLVVVTSDHGEEFGEHGKPGHGHTLFMELLHVPLVIRLPGRVPAGTTVPAAVSLRDVPSTVWDLLDLPGSGGLSGRSLAEYWAPGASPEARTIRADLDQSSSIVEGKYHYLKGARGRERLFDVAADPLEQHDLAGTEAGRALLPALQRMLEASKSQHGTGQPGR